MRAYIVATDPAAPPDPEQLRVYCRERLAGFKVPAQWMFAQTLPRNAVGKILRKELVSSNDDKLANQRGPAA
jgi:acyl-CoA synthetase (AMP-forming)/AMP-acid ligase II